MPAATVMAGLAAGIVYAILAIRRLVRLVREPALARAALAPEQTVTFTAPGPVELAIEGPLLTTSFRGLSFELVDPAGVALGLRPIWFRTRRSGFRRTRLSIRRATIATPGPHRLCIGGLGTGSRDGDCAVVFVRPRGAAIATTIVGLVASIFLAAGSIVVAVLLASPHAPGTAPVPTAELESHGGRSLVADAQRLAGAQEVVWPLRRMHVRVPHDWIVRTLGASELDLRAPSAPSTFLVAHASAIPAEPPAADYLRAHVAHARDQLAGALIDGYATRTFGSVPGVMTIEHREDGAVRMLTWTGVQRGEAVATYVTVLVGAAAPDFARDEALLGAILESIRFE